MPVADPIASADANVYEGLHGCFPDDQSKVCIRNADGGTLTYADVDTMAARFAAVLRDHGIRKGDRVVGVILKSPEAIVLYLATSRLGAVYVPVHSDLTLPEISYILSDAEPKLVVCDPAFEPGIAALGARSVEALLTLDVSGVGTLLAAAQKAQPLPVAKGRAGDTNAIVYTSGTTGKPKGAIITNGQVLWNAWALSEAWGMTERDVLLHANPIAFGLFGTTVPAIARAATILLLPKLDIDQVLHHLRFATMFSGTPTYYTRLLARAEFNAELCRSMRLFITGSAPMRADVFNQFRARTGHALLDRYGLTEALLVTSNVAGEERRPDTSGRPLKGSSVRVVDDEGSPLGPGQVGKIEIKQPHMFTGYWKAPEKTAATFTRDGWMITGDFGRMDEAGYLTVLGRGVDLIISGGFNVYPKEVETVLNKIENVAESAVVGIPHPDFGEAVVAAVELVDSQREFDAKQVIAAMKKELTGYKVPKRIDVVGQLPRNTLGKIQKNLIKKLMTEAG